MRRKNTQNLNTEEIHTVRTHTLSETQHNTTHTFTDTQYRGKHNTPAHELALGAAKCGQAKALFALHTDRHSPKNPDHFCE